MTILEDRQRTPFATSGDWTLRILGAALVLSVLLSIQQTLGISYAGRDLPFDRVLADVVPYWLLWAAATPVVAWSVRRFGPSSSLSRGARLAYQFAVAIALMLVHSAALYTTQLLFGLTDLHIPIWKGAFAVSQWRLASNVLVYATLLGVSHTTDASRRAAVAVRRAHERELTAARLSEQLATARLHALRMQLNPHFLFNVLNTVAMLVRRGDGQGAIRVLAGSSDLLRYCLSVTSSGDVPLDEELAFIRKYLSIEQARFGDSLAVTIEASPESLAARVPSLILHPIVENAVRHGASLASHGGAIRVSARRVGESLVLQVADNGPGVRDHEADDSEGAGVGIRNTIERLSHLHGSDFEFELHNLSVGAVATISLPFSTQSATTAPS